MQVVDVMAFSQVNERASVLQSKAKKPVRFEISEGKQASLETWSQDTLMTRSVYLWLKRFHDLLNISMRQYASVVRDTVTLIGLEASVCGAN